MMFYNKPTNQNPIMANYTVDQYLDRLDNGYTDIETCKMLGVPQSTFAAWKRRWKLNGTPKHSVADFNRHIQNGLTREDIRKRWRLSEKRFLILLRDWGIVPKAAIRISNEIEVLPLPYVDIDKYREPTRKNYEYLVHMAGYKDYEIAEMWYIVPETLGYKKKKWKYPKDSRYRVEWYFKLLNMGYIPIQICTMWGMSPQHFYQWRKKRGIGRFTRNIEEIAK